MSKEDRQIVLRSEPATHESAHHGRGKSVAITFFDRAEKPTGPVRRDNFLNRLQERYAPADTSDSVVARGFGVTHIRPIDGPGKWLYTAGGDRIPYKMATKTTPGFDETIYAQLEVGGVAYPQTVGNFLSSCVIS